MITNLTIRPATAADIPAVMRIAAEHDLSGKSPERIRREGFLVSRYEESVYQQNLHGLTVALAGSEVAGFTLTFMRHELPPEVKDGPRIESVIGDAPYFLIKQVGVALAHQRRKVGRALYEHLLSGLTIPAFAPIVISPDHVNICSTAFHEKLGFTQVESLNDAHGQPISGLWCRPAPQA